MRNSIFPSIAAVWFGIAAKIGKHRLNCSLAFFLALWTVHAQAGMDDARVHFAKGRYAEAMKEYEIYAARGFGHADFMIATMFANGQGVARDVEMAIKHAKRAADHGAPEGFALIALLYDSDKSGIKDEKNAVEWLQKGVDISDLNSMRILATRYRDGRGVPRDLKMAHTLFERAARDDDFRSIYELGQLYERGLGVETDERVARRWYERLLSPRHRLRNVNYLEFYVPLAGLMEKSPTSVHDLAEAASIFEDAANAGNVEAMYRLGRILELGRGRAASPDLAAIWYEKAADGGDGRANYRGGLLFKEGRGVKKDPGEALNWFQEGALRGNVQAMRAIGRALDEGVNGVSDRAMALSWFCKAAVTDKTWQSQGAVAASGAIKQLASLKRCISLENPLPAAQSLYSSLASTFPSSVFVQAELLALSDSAISAIVDTDE